MHSETALLLGLPGSFGHSMKILQNLELICEPQTVILTHFELFCKFVNNNT